MDRIYFDQASSCFPRPREVLDSVYDCLVNYGININRSTSSGGYHLEEQVYECREKIAAFFHAKDSRLVAFTKNVTESLNIVIKGLFRPGDHVLTSGMEHNAVIRPLEQMKQHGVSYDLLPCHADGRLRIEDISRKIKKHTRALILTHASNVCGTLMPLQEVGALCKEHNILFIVDAAQTAGRIPIYMQEMHIDILCFTGHKSLMGPQGSGGVVFNDEVYRQIDPLIAGGTGSISSSIQMPEFMPDKFEAGTPNIPAIIGLYTALQWIEKRGTEPIHAHEMALTERFIAGLQDLHIPFVGMQSCSDRVAVVSLHLKKDMALVANELEERFGIVTRVGMHCAPLAHQSLGTYPEGTLRFSFGCFNTPAEIDIALSALKEILWN